MKKILVLAHKNYLRPSLRYRIIYPLEYMKTKKIIDYKLLSVYSVKTEALMSTRKQVLKAISMFFDICVFGVKFIVECRKDYDFIFVKDFIFPLGGNFTEWIFYILLKNKTIIYDLDDAIYFNHTRVQNAFFSQFRKMDQKVLFWIKYAKKVIIPNNIIQKDLEKKYHLKRNDEVILITCPKKQQYYDIADDIDKKTIDGEIPIVWLGSPHTQGELDIFDDVIRKILLEFPEARIYLIGTGYDYEGNIMDNRIIKVEWNLSNEVFFMRKAIFGFNPLRNDIFQQRKSAFKVIQYYRAGIFPIVSDVGINGGLIDEYGGFCIGKNTNMDSLIYEMRLHINHVNENSKKIYKNSYDLTVENYAQIIGKEIFMTEIGEEN